MVFHLHSGIDIIEASLLHIPLHYIIVYKICPPKKYQNLSLKNSNLKISYFTKIIYPKKSDGDPCI